MAFIKWYHFIPAIGQVVLVGELIDKGFDDRTASANAIFNSNRPANLTELKQRLNLEIESFDKRINLNKAELAISNVFGLVYARGIDVVVPGSGQVFLQNYSKINQSNISLKEREIIEWLNAIQVRLGVLALIDNPKIKFSFDVYDTNSYPLNAESLKEKVLDVSKIVETPEGIPKEAVNWVLYLSIGGVIIVVGVLVLIVIKRFK